MVASTFRKVAHKLSKSQAPSNTSFKGFSEVISTATFKTYHSKLVLPRAKITSYMVYFCNRRKVS